MMHTDEASLHMHDPFNLAASLLSRVGKGILDLEFVEMSEVTVDDDIPQVPGHSPPPGRQPIIDHSQWLEHYSLMAVTQVTRFSNLRTK